MRFYSKKGIILFPILLFVLLFTLLSVMVQFVNVDFLTALLGEQDTENPLTGVIIPLAAASLIVWLIIATYYEINGKMLKVVAGPIRYTIEIDRIKSVRPSRNPLSSPALSLDRLEIIYSKPTGKVETRFSWKTILISPKNKQKFIEELLKINPNIDVK
ncbi:PH domain-containing protein [Bacillus sp. SCS-153A]|uniref:PH domain-containing protein n=1 Tax=Rossellomorea sedimentorum TaxID=3115294 RepID=UPI0039065026